MEFQPIEGGPLRTAIAICVYYALWEEFDPGGIVRLPGTPSGDMIKELSERHTGKAVQTTTPVLFCIPNEPNKRTPYRLLVKHFAKPPGEQRTTELQQAKRMARQWMEGHVHASYQGAVRYALGLGAGVATQQAGTSAGVGGGEERSSRGISGAPTPVAAKRSPSPLPAPAKPTKGRRAVVPETDSSGSDGADERVSNTEASLDGESLSNDGDSEVEEEEEEAYVPRPTRRTGGRAASKDAGVGKAATAADVERINSDKEDGSSELSSGLASRPSSRGSTAGPSAPPARKPSAIQRPTTSASKDRPTPGSKTHSRPVGPFSAAASAVVIGKRRAQSPVVKVSASPKKYSRESAPVPSLDSKPPPIRADSPEAIVIQHVVPPLPTPAANPLPPPNGVVAPVAAAAPSTSESYIDSITDALSPMIRDIATRLVMDSGIKRKGLATLSSPDVLRELAKELEMMCLQKIAAHAED